MALAAPTPKTKPFNEFTTPQISHRQVEMLLNVPTALQGPNKVGKPAGKMLRTKLNTPLMLRNPLTHNRTSYQILFLTHLPFYSRDTSCANSSVGTHCDIAD